jgi:phage shock protein PspC (stress-responsive transcriptional regulator)
MSDTIDSTTTTTTIDDAPTRRLVRVHEGRWVGGVAAGLGRYFDVNPLVYRIAFAALAFAGGTGILLYLAALLVIPAEDREESIAVEALRRRRDQPWLLVGVGLLSFGALLALSEARFWPDPGNVWLAAILAGAAIVWWHVSGRTRKPGTVSAGVASADATAPPPPAPAPRRPSLLAPVAGALLAAAGLFGLLDVLDIYELDLAIALAVSVAVIGVAVAAGALTGRRVGGLVVLGLVLLAGFAAAASSPVSVNSGIGDRVEHAFAGQEIERTYELGIGDLTVDLGSAELPSGRTPVDARVGIGHLVIVVPADVAVDVDAHAGAGHVNVFGREDDGTGVRVDRFYPGATADAPVLELDADVAVGDLRIERG